MANFPVNNSDSLNPNGNGSANNALKDFNISGNVKEKTDIKFGEKIVEKCDQIINSSYFSERNTRFALNRAMAAGRMDMEKFKDFFNMGGKTNYVNISWKSIMIVNTIVARLVGRWMTKREKASVTAVDPVSIKEKKEKVDEAEFLLYNKDIMLQLQEQSGIKVVADDAYIPDDKDDLDLWAKEELRIPEEILYEKGANRVMEENGWGNMGLYERQIKHDSAEVGFVTAEVYADRQGKIHVDYLKPENRFYSEEDSADISKANIQGCVVAYTISEIRQMFPKLEVKEIIEISKSAKEFKNMDMIAFKNSSSWNIAASLPVDDWTVEVVRATFKTWDTDRKLFKKGKDGRTYVDNPKKKVEDVYEGNEYLEKDIWNIYRLIYVKASKKILEWGLEKNMIRPQAYEKIGTAYSPYCGYMYNPVKMRNLAIPEKIEEPVEQMILARLKIQQLVAKMRPAGYMYDIDGMQEMNLGNGVVTPLELTRITDQTGNVYYKSKDNEGNRIERPITENPNAAGAAQLQELISTYNYHQQVLRDEIGSNEFSEGQTIKPRTGVANVNTAMETSFNATDFINDACRSLKEQIAMRIGCLLKDSVEYGSKEYRDILKEGDIKNREFDIRVEILPDIDQLNEFDQSVNQMMQAQPDLVMYMNPEKIKRIARESVKLAEQYFRQAQKRALKGREESKQRDSEMNAQIQQQAGIAIEQEKQKSLAAELQVKMQIEGALSEAKNKQVILEGIFGIYQKGLPMPQELSDLANEIIMNVGMPLFAQNMENEQAMQQQAEQEQQAAQEQQMQAGQQPQEGQDPAQQEMPQEEGQPNEQMLQEQPM